MTQAMTTAYFQNAAVATPLDIGMLLVTFDHPDLEEPILVTDANVSVTSNGNTYTAWPFIPKLPSEGADGKRGGITIQNVDPKICRTLIALKGNITVYFEYVSREDPNSEFYDHGGLFMRNVEGDDMWINGEIVGYGADSQTWPRATMTPNDFPGLFV